MWCRALAAEREHSEVTAWTPDGAAEEMRTPIEHDRVLCQRIGWVSVDRCRDCLYLRRLVLDTDMSGYVVCSTSADIDDADFAW